MSDVSSVPPCTPMPSSLAGEAPPWSAGTPGWARNVISPCARRISRLATFSSALLPPWPLRNTSRSRRCGGDAAADVVEHRQQRGRRQPHRAGRPGVLVRLGVLQRRQQPRIDLVAELLDRRGSATAVAMTESVQSGRCGPCCSIAPSGCTMMLRSVSRSTMSGPVRSARYRPADDAAEGTRARYRSVPSATRMAPMPSTRLRRDRHRWRPQRSGVRRVPGSRRPAHAAARSSRIGRRHGSQRAVRRRHGQHLQLRPHHVSHDAGDGRAAAWPITVCGTSTSSRRSSTWRGAAARRGPIHHDVERTLDSIARHASRRGRRLPPLPEGGDAGGEAGASTRPTIHRRSEGCRRKVVAKRGAGASTLLRWSRRSAADVMREFFRSDALAGPAMATGPMVWGISPETPGIGAGRADLRDAARRHASVGRSAAAAWCRSQHRAGLRRRRRHACASTRRCRRSPARARRPRHPPAPTAPR